MRQGVKKIVKFALISILFIFIIVFAFFRSKNLIFGVKIENVNVIDGSKLTNNIMNINGNAKNAVNLALNGREISINQQGDFDETIALLPGYNAIEIKAQDKFGQRDEKNYKLIY